jgi:hypothetical protein
MDVRKQIVALVPFAFLLATGAAAQSDGNRPPAISGSPPGDATVGQRYYFRPSASDRDRDVLTFGISNRPRWASFDTRTGRLAGTPATGDRETYSDIRIRVSDGQATRALDPFRIVVRAAAQNRPPVISGSPPGAIAEGQAYSFGPTASDPDGDGLVFSITKRPAWASFDTQTGRLYGRPGAGAVGTYSGVRIRVSDGLASVALPAFSIAVTQSADGGVTISWNSPTTREDGSPLVNLAGFRIRYGSATGNYPNTIMLNNPGLTSSRVENLAPGRWYFVIAAFDSSGSFSANTTPVSAAIP